MNDSFYIWIFFENLTRITTITILSLLHLEGAFGPIGWLPMILTPITQLDFREGCVADMPHSVADTPPSADNMSLFLKPSIIG